MGLLYLYLYLHQVTSQKSEDLVHTAAEAANQLTLSFFHVKFHALLSSF